MIFKSEGKFGVFCMQQLLCLQSLDKDIISKDVNGVIYIIIES